LAAGAFQLGMYLLTVSWRARRKLLRVLILGIRTVGAYTTTGIIVATTAQQKYGITVPLPTAAACSAAYGAVSFACGGLKFKNKTEPATGGNACESWLFE
jgi:hypothetical protein